MKPRPLTTHRQTGSVLLIALATITILTVFAAITFARLHQRHLIIQHSASWHEALASAESGIDIGLADLRQSMIVGPSILASYNTSTATVDGQTVTRLSRVTPALQQEGEGGSRFWAEIDIESAPSLIVNGRQAYIIRSRGVCELTGGSIVAGDKADNQLRRLTFYRDRKTNGLVSTPRATRTVEVVALPAAGAAFALATRQFALLNDPGILVDSYDSTLGPYDPAYARTNGDIVTLGASLYLSGAQVRGDAATNNGVVSGGGNVEGQIRSDFGYEFSPVQTPAIIPEFGSPDQITSSTTLSATSTGTAYALTEITLDGGQSLTIQGDPGGAPTKATIVVTGEMKVATGAKIVLDPGVTLEIYLQSDAALARNAVVNPGRPKNFRLLGVSRPAYQPKGNLSIHGDGELKAMVNAPDHNITLTGSSPSDALLGSITANSVVLSGTQSFHFDESLEELAPSDFQIASWVEDTE